MRERAECAKEKDDDVVELKRRVMVRRVIRKSMFSFSIQCSGVC